ncbi:MAG: protein-export membrane protein SecD [Epulopiscium sp. Nele67-Bin005]|nr:MAG: protein-export membrane protein SecD [Epulopiscium sp. Nele67-Bin005]
MRKNIGVLLLVILAIIGACFVAYNGLGDEQLLSYHNIKLGLDLQGGVNIVYEAGIDSPSIDEMNAAVQMIQVRLDKENYTEAEVAVEGTNRIRVNIPGVSDPQEAIENIGASAILTFEDEEGNVVLEGKNIAKASPQIIESNFGGQEAAVAIELDKEGTDLFATATKENLGKAIVIKLDDIIISAPIVNAEIRDGKSVISGNFTTDSAKQLAERIEAGALPFALIPISSTSVGAKLGMDAFNSSLQAGTIGFGIVMIFMIMMYKLSGLVADIALILYVALIIICLSWIRSTITLPGIAGIILSIGMAVDANIIIFTRIKEELKRGRSVKSAIDAGFNKAFTGIIDGNITTLIASVVLYVLGSGIIKSFATTLGIGIILSMFTALVVTKLLLGLFFEVGANKPQFYGYKETEVK